MPIRKCAFCDVTPRYDDHFTMVYYRGETGYACEACQARAEGRDAPVLRVYPRGVRVPRKPGSDGDLPVCGMCRLALREDEREPTCVRLADEDVAGTMHEAGVHPMCRECVARWKPVLAARLGRPETQLVGDALL